MVIQARLSDPCQWDLMALWRQPLPQGPFRQAPRSLSFVEYLLMPGTALSDLPTLWILPATPGLGITISLLKVG